MLPLPDANYSNPQVLASWIELTSLSEDGVAVVHGEAMEWMRDSTMYDDASNRDRDSSNAHSSAAILNAAWTILETRQRQLGDAWPFLLRRDAIERAIGKETIESVAAYATMLLIEAGVLKWYERLSIPKSAQVRTWFEYIVSASLENLSRGTTVRFGVPFSPEWPSSFPDRVRHLGSLFGIRAREQEVSELASPAQQDDSLDVLSRWNFADGSEGSPYLLLQCATGAGWRDEKNGEPRMALWGKYLDWDGPQLKALALPFALRERGELKKACIRHEYALIFDRLRIASGNPDARISADMKLKLSTWCRESFQSISRKSQTPAVHGDSKIVAERSGDKSIPKKVIPKSAPIKKRKMP